MDLALYKINSIIIILYYKILVYLCRYIDESTRGFYVYNGNHMVHSSRKVERFCFATKVFFELLRLVPCKIVVMTIDNPGMFVIYDVIPSKGW